MTTINPTLATKLVDTMIDEFVIAHEKDLPKDLTRLEIKEIIHSMSNSRTAGKITLHFNEQGKITPEVTLKGDAVLKHFMERKS